MQSALTAAAPDPEAGRPIVDRIPLIPRATRLHGPLTAARLRRSYLALGALFVAGVLPTLLGLAPKWQALGLGLLFPGAGFLFAGTALSILFAVLSAAAFATVLFIWWARGPVLLPPGVLAGTALLSAAWMGEGQGVAWLGVAIPLAVAAMHGGFALRRRGDFRRAQARADRFNEGIARAEPLLREAPIAASPEMGDAQVGEYRRMLDLALQPVDEWQGFAFEDRWQDGALRYQLATMSWNLAFGQYTQLPAFHGQLNTAQERLIRKNIDRKTWNYWFWESLWGNFEHQRNPIRTDNIMLSGFLGVSLGLFETASGTSPFAAPGALTFRFDDKHSYPYSHQTMLEEVARNFERYDYGWFPCEPRWIYSMCNLVGRTALDLHDKRNGTKLIERIGDRFDRTMADEMTLADGRIRVCTSSTFGFTVPSLSGLFGETWGIRFMTPYAPAEAERLWQVLKQDFMHVTDDGLLDFRLLPLGWDTRKPSDFSKWPELNPLIMVLWSATEMGDQAVIDATRTTIAQRYGPGIADAMTWTRPNTMRDMVNTGLPQAWRTGPLLTDAPYPDVVVTRAVSDGDALSLVLQPGGEGGRVVLGFGRLKPGRGYRVLQTGEALIAGAGGEARLTALVGGRTELDLVPVA